MVACLLDCLVGFIPVLFADFGLVWFWFGLVWFGLAWFVSFCFVLSLVLKIRTVRVL